MRKASKINGKFNSSAVVATLCVAGWVSAQAQDSPIGGVNQPQAQAESPSTSIQPMRMNKCSQLIGAVVENPQGDKLGKIEEIVVDLESGRVSYCVLSVEHKLFATPKFLAVPLAAFQPSSDGLRLILNADKDKIAQAQGFDRDSWPSVTNQAWGAQPFWQSTPKATITKPTDQNKENKDTPSGTSH